MELLQIVVRNGRDRVEIESILYATSIQGPKKRNKYKFILQALYITRFFCPIKYIRSVVSNVVLKNVGTKACTARTKETK